jgi:uncharacterized membrane protein YqjE
MSQKKKEEDDLDTKFKNMKEFLHSYKKNHDLEENSDEENQTLKKISKENPNKDKNLEINVELFPEDDFVPDNIPKEIEKVVEIPVMKKPERFKKFLTGDIHDDFVSTVNPTIQFPKNENEIKIFLKSLKSKEFLRGIPEFQDKKIVLEAVKENGLLLEFTSSDLKKDKEIVTEAVKRNGFSFEHASENLKNDKEFVLQIVQINGFSVRYASEELRNNKEIVLEAVKQNGISLLFASQQLKEDKEISLQAIKDNMYSIRHVSEELQKDKEILLEALKKKSNVLPTKYMNIEMKYDMEICWILMKYYTTIKSTKSTFDIGFKFSWGE